MELEGWGEDTIYCVAMFTASDSAQRQGMMKLRTEERERGKMLVDVVCSEWLACFWLARSTVFLPQSRLASVGKKFGRGAALVVHRSPILRWPCTNLIGAILTAVGPLQSWKPTQGRALVPGGYNRGPGAEGVLLHALERLQKCAGRYFRG